MQKLKNAIADNPNFWIACGSLLLGIALACGVWLSIRPHSALTDEAAQKMRFRDARDYEGLMDWIDTASKHSRQKKFSVSDVHAAEELLKTSSPTAQGQILIILCGDASGTSSEKEAARVALKFCSSTDSNIRQALALTLHYLHTPEAKAAYERMKDDPNPEVRNEVRGRLGIANAK